jgi:4-amino-4-deoxy-L-arabinose transferase-like glycosyltransferase
VLVAMVTALAAALRLLWLSDVPPGLYHDEGYNGLDALRVLSGRWSVYFPGNNGREPLFIYIVAATVGLLGRTPGAVRLAAAISGTLTIPATYLMARTWFNRRVAFTGTVVLAITLWHIQLSRVGFRAVTLPLVTALALWLGGRAYRSGRRREWFMAGIVYGLCYYSYLPIRFSPVALVLFAAVIVLCGGRRRLWPGAAWFLVAAALALLPLAVYTLSQWDVVMARAGQVSVLNPDINEGDLWGTIGRHLVNTLGMFFVRGDTIPRHNLPGRPVFDPLLAGAMIVGLVRVVRRRRSEPAALLATMWIAVMLLPTWFAEDAPHFLRAAGALPLLAFLPALGLDAASTWLERRGRAGWAIPLTVTVLTLSTLMATRDYFWLFASDQSVAYAFEDAATRLAVEANRFVGSGWDGEGLSARESEPTGDRMALVDGRLWDDWQAIPFLVSDSGAVVRLPRYEPLDTVPALEGGLGSEALLLLWPYGGVERYQELIPRYVPIEVREGPQARGDLEEVSHAAYVGITVCAGEVLPASHIVVFDDQIALLDYDVEQVGLEWRVVLHWQAMEWPERDYTVFVHLRDGSHIVAQHDGQPTDGCYPTSLWRPGDVVVDTHVVNVDTAWEWGGDSLLAVGLYQWPTLERLPAFLPSGEPLGDEFTLSIEDIGRH